MKKIKQYFSLSDLISLVPVVFFVFVNFPYFGEAPALDPMVIYRESSQFFYGGIKEIIHYGVTVHPPLIYILNNLGFLIFGKSPLAYTLVGLTIFSITSIFGYFGIKKLFGFKTAAIFCLLLFTNPFVIANSFFLSNDMLILYGTIIALILFCLRKYLSLSLILGLMMIMKETAVLIVGIFFIVILFEIALELKKVKHIKIFRFKNLAVFIPALIVFTLWRFQLDSLGTTEWRETFFIKTSDNSYETVVKRLVSFKFFDIFTVQNLRNTFLLHFQWIFTFSILMLLPFFKRDRLIKRQRIFLITLIFLSIVYLIMALTFPTWTVPRYGLPIYFGIFFLLSFIISRIRFQKLIPGLIVLFLGLNLVSNYRSADPFSLLYGVFKMNDINFYNIPFMNSGPDRMIYNRTYLEVTRKQNAAIKSFLKSEADVFVTNCNDLKLGEKIWSISIHNNFYPGMTLDRKIDCINFFELDNIYLKSKVENKKLFVPKNELENTKTLLHKNGIAYKKIVTD